MKFSQDVQDICQRYPSCKSQMVFRYYYIITHALSFLRHKSLADISRELGHDRQFTFEMFRYHSTVHLDYYTARCDDVLKELNLTDYEEKTIRQDAHELLPKLYGKSNFMEIVRDYFFWEKLDTLTPLAKAVKDSDLTISKIAERRHVAYHTVAVSIRGSRIDLVVLFDMARILRIDPIKLELAYHPELPKSQRYSFVHNTMKNYLFHINPSQVKRYPYGSQQILKTYVETNSTFKSTLMYIFKLYRLIHLPLLTCLRWWKGFHHLQPGSPAFTLVRILQAADVCHRSIPLAEDSKVYVQIRGIVKLVHTKDMVSKKAADIIYQAYPMTDIKFPRVKYFYNASYRNIYHLHKSKMEAKGISIHGKMGIKILKFCCVNGISLAQVSRKMHVSRSRIEQITMNDYVDTYPIHEFSKLYPQFKIQIDKGEI